MKKKTVNLSRIPEFGYAEAGLTVSIKQDSLPKGPTVNQNGI
ncbi:hypothetical protein ACFWGC_02315 [Cytobacillus pseudoceanisediminis]